MENKSRRQTATENVPIRFHPRVFAALGADLVTSDVVAIIELVKNAYDALAKNVWIKFTHDDQFGSYLEIKDDGIGMSKRTLKEVWCLVATPYKAQNPTAQSGRLKRRVSGEKGLGRLSAARLGLKLQMITKFSDESCVELNIDWSAISKSDTLEASHAEISSYLGHPPFKSTGTLLRILGLKTEWGNNEISELEDNLARLVSPFVRDNDFSIFLSNGEDTSSEPVRIEAPEFLSFPKYSIEGKVDRLGNVEAHYKYSPID